MSAPAFNPPVGEPPSIELIPVGRLRIDETYQRSIETAASQRLIARIARDWDWRLCVPLLASRREDGLYVIDGQHRLQGARSRGDIAYLPCCVSDYGSPADEAQVFVEANRKRRSVSRVDTFRAAQLAGDPTATTLSQLLDQAGLRLARFGSPTLLDAGEIVCISALERSLSRYGQRTLAAVLAAIATAFDGQVMRHSAPFIHAGCMILTDRPNLPDGYFAAVLARHTPAEWFDIANAQPGGVQGGQSAIWAMKRAIVAELDGARPETGGGVAKPKPPERRPLSFEEQMAAVANGARLVDRPVFRKPDPEGTLGGVGSSML